MTEDEGVEEDALCRLSRRLRYHRPSPCQARFACSSLGGHPCGEYGMQVAVVDDGETVK